MKEFARKMEETDNQEAICMESQRNKVLMQEKALLIRKLDKTSLHLEKVDKFWQEKEKEY